MVPQTQYAKKGDAHIAYQIVGEDNTLDIVLVSTWFSHLEARWDLPAMRTTWAASFTFVEHGTHTLKGVPDQWEILEAVE